MKNLILIVGGIVFSFMAGYYVRPYINSSKSTAEVIAAIDKRDQIKNKNMETSNLKLGAFSISLSVKDLKTSKSFYENLGFTVNGGGMEMNYLIMKNENALIGLFQGMFDGNILTFNPGWNEEAKNIEHYNDVREIQQSIKNKGIALMTEASDTTTGPASIMLTDPDGNLLLIDQHR